jgi:hypothetical protein
VDVTLVLAVLAGAAALTAPSPLDLQHLPRLPDRGLARETKTGVELQTMRGRTLGVLKGLDLADDKDSGRGLLMRDRRGRLFAIDLYEQRVRQVFPMPPRVPACRLTDARVNLELLVCGRTVKIALYRPSGETRRSTWSHAGRAASATGCGPSSRRTATRFSPSGPQNAKCRLRTSSPAA